ncbi:MAG: phage tail tube protein [Candidatus Brocadiia bacterium]
MGHKLGKDCKFYYSSTLLDGATNTPATVSWNEVGNVRDLTLNLETGEADVTTRANNGWRATAATLKDGSLEFEMLWDTGDAAFAALKDAWAGGGEIALAAMDGDIQTSGNEGLAGNFSVTNFSRNEPLEEGVTVSVTVKPSSQTEWYEAA